MVQTKVTLPPESPQQAPKRVWGAKVCQWKITNDEVKRRSRLGLQALAYCRNENHTIHIYFGMTKIQFSSIFTIFIFRRKQQPVCWGLLVISLLQSSYVCEPVSKFQSQKMKVSISWWWNALSKSFIANNYGQTSAFLSRTAKSVPLLIHLFQSGSHIAKWPGEWGTDQRRFFFNQPWHLPKSRMAKKPVNPAWPIPSGRTT